MPDTIPQFMLGKHFTSILLTPCSVATASGTAGDLTPVTGSAVQCYSRKKGYTESQSFNGEEINHDASVRENTVTLSFGASVEVELLMPLRGYTPEDINALFDAYAYFLVARRNQYGTLDKTASMYLRVESYVLVSAGRGAARVNLALGPVDAGANTYVYGNT